MPSIALITLLIIVLFVAIVATACRLIWDKSSPQLGDWLCLTSLVRENNLELARLGGRRLTSMFDKLITIPAVALTCHLSLKPFIPNSDLTVTVLECCHIGIVLQKVSSATIFIQCSFQSTRLLLRAASILTSLFIMSWAVAGQVLLIRLYRPFPMPYDQSNRCQSLFMLVIVQSLPAILYDLILSVMIFLISTSQKKEPRVLVIKASLATLNLAALIISGVRLSLAASHAIDPDPQLHSSSPSQYEPPTIDDTRVKVFILSTLELGVSGICCCSVALGQLLARITSNKSTSTSGGIFLLGSQSSAPTGFTASGRTRKMSYTVESESGRTGDLM